MKLEKFIHSCTLLVVVGSLDVAFGSLQRQPTSEFLGELSIGLKNDWNMKLADAQHSAWFKKAEGSLRGKRTLSSADYQATGFVYHNLYVGTDGVSICDGPGTNVYGEAANQCFELDGASYKYLIAAADGCAGAIVEYYSDAACGTFVGSTPLEPIADLCEETDLSKLFASYLHVPVLYSLKCSASAAPVVPQQPFLDPSCNGLEPTFQSNAENIRSYTSFIGYYSEAATCSSTSAIGFFYNATTTSLTNQAFTAVCFRNLYSEPMSPTFDDYNGYGYSESGSVPAYASEYGYDLLPAEEDGAAYYGYQYSDLADTIDDLVPSVQRRSYLAASESESKESNEAFEPPTFMPPAYAHGGPVPQMDPSVKNQDAPLTVQDVDKLSFFLGYCAPVLSTISPINTPPSHQRETAETAETAEPIELTEAVARAVRPVPGQGAPCSMGRADDVQSNADLDDFAQDIALLQAEFAGRALMTATADLPAHTPVQAWKIHLAPETILLANSARTPAPVVVTFGAVLVPVWVLGCGAVLIVLLAVAACSAPSK